MTSPCDQQNKHHLPTAILFFKVIVRTTLAVGRLKIPNNFTRKYGGGLSNPVFLKPPDGIEWKVYWTKHGGEIWFQMGWKEFARYYSLDDGHLVFFKYEGTSHFDVHIFDMSAVEIDYTFHVIHTQKDSLDQISEDSVEILDEHSPCQRTRLKLTLSSPQPRKKMRACRIRDVERSSNPQNLHQHVQTKGTNFEMPMVTSVKQELDEDVGGGIFSIKCPKVEQLFSTKTTVASITATTFRSKNPFFTLVTKPSHVNGYSLTIPLQFAELYLKKTKGVLLLQVLDGRTWSVIYNVPKITAGWNKFASENNLNLGDVCVFELTKKGSLSFKVFIFRVAEETSCPLSRVQGDGGIYSDPKRIMDFECRNASQTTPLLISPCLGMTRSLKEAENFSSTNPIFIVNIRLRHMGTTGPNVACVFVRKYFGKKKRTLIIQFGKRLWPVNFLYDGSNGSGKLSRGWSLFAEESKLKAGDVCIFELINRENAVLGVHVFRGHS